MEITLEKIELVKDRTGVSYKEAKEALEAADGSVVDAIIAIEETVDVKPGAKANEFAAETVAKIKELVKKGNVSKISVKKGDESIVNIPFTARRRAKRKSPSAWLVPPLWQPLASNARSS